MTFGSLVLFQTLPQAAPENWVIVRNDGVYFITHFNLPSDE